MLLRWALQRGFAILPKSTSAARIAENRDLFRPAHVLSSPEMAELDALDRDEVMIG